MYPMLYPHKFPDLFPHFKTKHKKRKRSKKKDKNGKKIKLILPSGAELKLNKKEFIQYQLALLNQNSVEGPLGN